MVRPIMEVYRMSKTKKQCVFQVMCCWLLSIGTSICFWAVRLPETIMRLLTFSVIACSIVECVIVWKKCCYRQTIIALAPAKTVSLMLSLVFCRQFYTIALPTPKISFDAIVILYGLYLPGVIVPAVFTIIKKRIEEKSKWGKLYFGGNLFVLIVSEIVVSIATWLLSIAVWQGYN